MIRCMSCGEKGALKTTQQKLATFIVNHPPKKIKTMNSKAGADTDKNTDTGLYFIHMFLFMCVCVCVCVTYCMPICVCAFEFG